MKGTEFQTRTSPPILPKLDILLYLSWGAYQTQSKVSYSLLTTGQQG